MLSTALIDSTIISDNIFSYLSNDDLNNLCLLNKRFYAAASQRKNQFKPDLAFRILCKMVDEWSGLVADIQQKCYRKILTKDLLIGTLGLSLIALILYLADEFNNYNFPLPAAPEPVKHYIDTFVGKRQIGYKSGGHYIPPSSQQLKDQYQREIENHYVYVILTWVFACALTCFPARYCGVVGCFNGVSTIFNKKYSAYRSLNANEDELEKLYSLLLKFHHRSYELAVLLKELAELNPASTSLLGLARLVGKIDLANRLDRGSYLDQSGELKKRWFYRIRKDFMELQDATCQLMPTLTINSTLLKWGSLLEPCSVIRKSMFEPRHPLAFMPKIRKAATSVLATVEIPDTTEVTSARAKHSIFRNKKSTAIADDCIPLLEMT